MLLAHAALVRDAAADPAGAGATLYLPLAMLAWFIACYGLAIVYRKAPALHARFMIGSCLAAVDPIAARLAAFYLPPFDHPARYELVSGSVAAAILGLAIAIDRRAIDATQPAITAARPAIGAAPPAIPADRGARRGRAVFPVMLAAIAGLFALWFWFAHRRPGAPSRAGSTGCP